MMVAARSLFSRVFQGVRSPIRRAIASTVRAKRNCFQITATAPCVAQENGVGKTELGMPFARRVAAAVLAPSLALAVSACATPTVTRSCLTQAQYEQLKASEPPKVHDKLTGKADEDVRPLAGSALELRAWGHAMLDTLKICSTP